MNLVEHFPVGTKFYLCQDDGQTLDNFAWEKTSVKENITMSLLTDQLFYQVRLMG